MDPKNTETRTDHEARAKVWDMIKDIRISLMVTHDYEGQLRSRPMAAQQEDFDGELWFFTSEQSGKIEELEANPQVLLGYADTSSQNYVSITGTAEIVRDQAKVKQLWTEMLRTWFPKGHDDPDIALIKVKAEHAEYWDSASSMMVHAYGYVKARLTGEAPDPGEHGSVHFV